MLATFILPLGGVILVDLVLSGDNALVIGAAIANIPESWRKFALVLGGAAAILLRIVFTIFTTFLLHISYIQTIGGILVLWITWRLLVEPEQNESATKQADQQDQAGNRLFTLIVLFFSRLKQLVTNVTQPRRNPLLIAILTIVITDLSTSSDNIIAVAALAHGQLIILGIGLVISITILLIGSALVARALRRYPNLIILSGFILAWIAGSLIIQDMSNLFMFIRQNMLYVNIASYLPTSAFAGYATYKRWKRQRRLPPPPKDGNSNPPRGNKRPSSRVKSSPLQQELQFVQ